jgi:hypothetical protein
MDDKKKMLLDWMRKIHQLEYAHCYQSISYEKVEKCIGVSAFVLSTVVAFSYRFPDVKNEFFNQYFFFLKKEYSIPTLSFIVALFTGLQTFLKPSEKSENHKKIGFSYEKLRHRIEMILTNDFDKGSLDIEIKEIKTQWDELDSVYVSDGNFIKGKEKVKSFKKYPPELSFLPDVG